MPALTELIANLRDPRALVEWAGYAGVTLIIFAETGMLIGVFFPGDSLLVAAGLLATKGMFSVVELGLLVSVAAVAGGIAGYAIGRATGPRIFSREDSLLFHRRHLLEAHAFYERHGGKTILLARFMPIVRTFAPVIAGVGTMDYRTFMTYNCIGGIGWAWSMLFIGFGLGRYIPGIDEHIDVVILAVIAVSILPGVVGWWRNRSAPAAPPPR